MTTSLPPTTLPPTARPPPLAAAPSLPAGNPLGAP